MPFIHRSNNRILPSNSRAVDVAVRTIRDLTPVEQRQYHNAFMVEGYEAILYTRLWQGEPCSCQSRRKTAATYLNEEGKLAPGTINDLMTGGLEFRINRYGATSKPSSEMSEARQTDGAGRDEQFFGDLKNENQTLFPISGNARHLEDPYLDVTDSDGVNGPNENLEIDDLTPEFDADVLDLSGTRCTCCFGTGWVGGYSILGGWRKVIAPASPNKTLVTGSVEANVFPNAWFATRIETAVTLPRGFVNLDTFRVWNNTQRVQATILLDGLPFSPQLFAALCDGNEHQVVLSFEEPTYVTHIEMQVALSRESALIEFPKINKNGQAQLQDLTGDVQLAASPLIPHIGVQDVLVESTFGKPFIIKSVDMWNDRSRNVHGWECDARVIQPSEILAFLPRRRQLLQRTSHAVRDNSNGIRRT